LALVSAVLPQLLSTVTIGGEDTEVMAYDIKDELVLQQPEEVFLDLR